MDAVLERFNQIFVKDEDCFSFIYKLKWPAGFRCPRCGHCHAYMITTRKLPLYECRSCGHQTTLTAGTIFHKSRTSLSKWLLVLYIVSSTENSMNAVQLSRFLQVTYKTAWAMLRKVRETISHYDGETPLSGMVEAKHEIYMKQPSPMLFSETNIEQSVIAASGTCTGHPPYFKIKLAPDNPPSYRNLNRKAEDAFIRAQIKPDMSQLTVSRWSNNLPGCEDVLPQLAKAAFRWLNDTFHGLSPASSQAFFDEYCYRRNAAAHSNGSPLEHLATLCVAGKSMDGETKSFEHLWTPPMLASIKKVYLERPRMDWSFLLNSAS